MKSVPFFVRLGAPMLAVALAACSKPAPPAEEIRPVRVTTVQPQQFAVAAEFSGEVRPRIESKLGFRVGGKVVSRQVELGQKVKKGDVLAQLDPQDFRLSEAAAKAQLSAAQVERTQNEADYKRFLELHERGFISAAELERRKAARDASAARYRQALAGLRSQHNQADYTVLKADADGIVTAVDAEAGQVVQAGQSVIRIAQAQEKEIAVSVPENRLNSLHGVRDIQVRLWSGGPILAGKIREISPMADPATRTYPVRVTLVNPPPEVAWGMTASVLLAGPSQAVLKLPMQALFNEGGKTWVWIYDAKTSTVKKSPVELVAADANELVVSRGLVPGQSVVTAGVHRLQEGQKVKVLPEPATPTARAEYDPAHSSFTQGAPAEPPAPAPSAPQNGGV